MNARSIILVAGLTGVFGLDANALGIVRAPAQVTLGATLNFAVAVQLASDESLSSPCINAEVLQGEQRIPPSTLHIQVEPGPVAEERVVRVTSTVAIEEPFVTITISLGCGNRLERRFTVLADPPLVTVAAAPEPVQPVARSDAATAAPAPRSEPAPASAPVPGAGDAVAASPSALPAATTPRAPTPRTTAAPQTATTPRPAGAAPAPARRVARATPNAAPTAAAPRARVATAARRAEPSAPSGPRLQLDPVDPVAVATAASAAVAQKETPVRVAAVAASAAAAEQAASAAVATADAAADRMRQIEEGVAKLRADIERDREQTLVLRAQLARAQAASRLAPWLGAGMALMAALALWLWLRMRRLQREQQAQWWAASRQAANSKLPPPNPPTLHPMTLPPHMAPAAAPARPAAPPATAAPPGRTQSPAFRDSLFTSQQETRDVSIEELIDLEQQAEFFVVLGQDDAAIDLLIGHIRATGGTSPLPYLKLLEIYRRLGDRESYERTRERFNHRFNAYAPDWDSDLQHGRSLDEYPGIVQRLQQVWPSPLDAMAELEALMFRRDGGELFELPAYREVLFLYSLARDLLDHQGGPPTSIDVLLPLTESPGTFEPTTARPHLFTSAAGLAELSRATDPPIEVLRPSMPLEFDDRPSGSQGAVDLDPTKPLSIDDTVVFRRDDLELRNPDQRSDFADLPPPEPKK
jgi:hypothetical protein